VRGAGSFNINSRANPFRSGRIFLSEERGAEFTAGKQRRRGRNSRKRIAGAKVVRYGAVRARSVARSRSSGYGCIHVSY
jgi:hypothetical protein